MSEYSGDEIVLINQPDGSHAKITRAQLDAIRAAGFIVEPGPGIHADTTEAKKKILAAAKDCTDGGAHVGCSDPNCGCGGNLPT